MKANRFRFRVWDIANKRMGEVYTLMMNEEHGMTACVKHPCGNGRFIHDSLIVQATDGEPDQGIMLQSTGLLDANGTEIFEGDVVEEGGLRGVIKWHEKGARFFMDERTSTIFLMGFMGVVIGNIYQNPELLENADAQ
jgi:hypothetical protein